MTKTSLVDVSDLHINSSVALRPPLITLEDSGLDSASRSQCWLWECWLDFCNQVDRISGRVVAILNGDIGDLDAKGRTYQTVSENPADILKLVDKTLEPLISVVDAVIVVRGTPAHAGKTCWLEEAIAAALPSDKLIPQSEDIKSFWHFQGMVGDLRIDAAHHASMGRLPWTKANSINQLAFRAIHYYKAELGLPPPDYVFRAHNHMYGDSGGNFRETKAIYTPSWSLLTEYGYRRGFELQLADIGGVIVEDGRDRYIHYELEENRRIWALQV